MRNESKRFGFVRTLLALSALAAASCGGRLPGNGDGGVDVPLPAVTTWYEHVAPIAFQSCVNCHRPGGIAPFSLLTYEDARGFAAIMAARTAARTMPPMPVNNNGSCQTFANARWLSDREIAIFQAWADGGAVAGDPARGPAVPPPPAGLPRVDVTLDPGVAYTPSTARSDDYRCFLVDTGLTAESFLTGYEVVPGDARVVHHAIVYQPNDDAQAQRAAQMDAAEEGPGYTCFGGPGVNADPRVLWAPGVGATQLPANTGLPLAVGRRLILQIHYNTMRGAFPDQTRVRLAVADHVARSATFTAVADLAMRLPPQQEAATTTASVSLGTLVPYVTVYGVLPHMHTLGRTLHVEATTGTTNTCLVDVDRWDFHWQNAWWYPTPLALRSVNAVSIRCGYDTRTRTTETRWGESTSDEMCLNYLYVTIP